MSRAVPTATKLRVRFWSLDAARVTRQGEEAKWKIKSSGKTSTGHKRAQNMPEAGTYRATHARWCRQQLKSKAVYTVGVTISCLALLIRNR